MGAKQLSKKEIYFYAEQILLGSKHWPDLEHLADDDKMRIRTVVERGVQAFAEEQRKGTYVKKKLQRKERDRSKRSYIYVADRRPQSDLLDFAQAVPITLFSVEQLMAESTALRSRLMEHLNRHFHIDEIAALFKTFPVSLVTVLLASAPVGMREDIEQAMEFEEETEEGLDLPSLQRRLSMAVVLFLQDADDLSPNLSEYFGGYVAGLRKEFAAYCTELPLRVGINEILGALSEVQWKRLAGLTPRDDLAVFWHLLDEVCQRHMYQPLPERQQRELMEFVDLKAKERETDLEAYDSVVKKFKKWVALVNKVGREQ